MNAFQKMKSNLDQTWVGQTQKSGFFSKVEISDCGQYAYKHSDNAHEDGYTLWAAVAATNYAGACMLGEGPGIAYMPEILAGHVDFTDRITGPVNNLYKPAGATSSFVMPRYLKNRSELPVPYEEVAELEGRLAGVAGLTTNMDLHSGNSMLGERGLVVTDPWAWVDYDENHSSSVEEFLNQANRLPGRVYNEFRKACYRQRAQLLVMRFWIMCAAECDVLTFSVHGLFSRSMASWVISELENEGRDVTRLLKCLG